MILSQPTSTQKGDLEDALSFAIREGMVSLNLPPEIVALNDNLYFFLAFYFTDFFKIHFLSKRYRCL